MTLRFATLLILGTLVYLPIARAFPLGEAPQAGVDYIEQPNQAENEQSSLDALLGNDVPSSETPLPHPHHTTTVPPIASDIRFNVEQFYPRHPSTVINHQLTTAERKPNTKQPFSQLINQVAQEEQLDAQLLHAIISVESGYDSDIISPKGAIGLMQLMPATANRFGAHNPSNPLQNIRAGARYLRFLQTMYKGNMPLVLAAYNAGVGNVRRYRDQIPPFTETQDYVKKVLGRYQQRRNPYQLEMSSDGRMGTVIEAQSY